MGLIWSILIASHISRHRGFAQISKLLAPQLTPDIEVVVLWNRGESNIGAYRQALLEDARGDYVSFLDDDDRIPGDFCSQIVAALDSRPDYVGFELAFTNRTKSPIRTARAFHSLDYDGWSQDKRGYLRDISHLNPIRRQIALRGTFEGESGEDRSWAEQVRPFVKSQVYIDRVMYFYDYNRKRSVRGGARAEHRLGRPRLLGGFRFHSASDE